MTANSSSEWHAISDIIGGYLFIGKNDENWHSIWWFFLHSKHENINGRRSHQLFPHHSLSLSLEDFYNPLIFCVCVQAEEIQWISTSDINRTWQFASNEHEKELSKHWDAPSSHRMQLLLMDFPPCVYYSAHTWDYTLKSTSLHHVAYDLEGRNESQSLSDA